ncbi:tRNA epoxyqueuosine(34) reductase QueG [soil metagenome]
MSTPIKAALLYAARQLGFADCRVAAARAPAHAALYRQWVAEGKFGDMEWMARDPERRTDPQKVLPGARAIVVLATNYLPAETTPARPGRIARYAVGDDYHDLIEDRLRDLDAVLAEAGGTQRCYVDTGPLLERDLASEAGIGWNGKSTVQIHPELGTWFFLSEILTTLPLEPDAPHPDRCGSCTRCLDACPTDAITAPRRLDARRCISYLTIEHKGAIPDEFRRAIGDRIYGCDDCLSACPWNRFAQTASDAAFQAREHVSSFDLRDYLALSEEQFRALFRGSPIKRTGRSRFLRNVCVALGNVGTPEDLPALRCSAEGNDPLVAEHALWAIGEIGRRPANPSKI